MELIFQDLRALFPILGGYEYVGGSLDVVCKFFLNRDAWVENMQTVWDQVYSIVGIG